METFLFVDERERRLIERLRSVRLDYAQEMALHELWIDSYTGGGGFRNTRVPMQSAPFWGRDSYQYSDWAAYYGDYGIQLKDYIQAHRNEDGQDYNDRVCASVYTNPIEPIVDLTNAFLTAEDATRENLPEPLTAWMTNVNGLGLHIRGLVKDGLRRAQVVGRTFALVSPPENPGQTMAEAKRLGAKAEPRVLLLWPKQVYDYDVDEEGKLVAIKFGTYQEVPRKSMLDDKRTKERITIWTRDTWEYWDILLPCTGMTSSISSGGAFQSSTTRDTIIDHQQGVNELGEVPVTVLCWKQPLGDNRSIAGLPQISTLAQLARALYNRMSELDDHLRKSNFAQLVIPDDGEDGDGGDSSSVVHVGAANGIRETKDGKGISRYISPPEHIAVVYETRINTLLDDIYRNALIDRGERKVAEKAEAMRMRFVQTNNILAEVAERLDVWEMSIYRLVAKIKRMPENSLAQGMVRRKREYQAAALDEQIENVIKAKELPIGPIGGASLVKRTYRALNPDLPTAEYNVIDKEIDEKAKTMFSLEMKVQPKRQTPADDIQRAGTPQVEPEEQKYVASWRADLPGT